MTRFSILIAHSETVAPAGLVHRHEAFEGRFEALAVQGYRHAARKLDSDLLGLDLHIAAPVREPHDWLDDPHATVEPLQVLRLVGGAEDVGIRRVRLFGRHRVGQLHGGEVLAHLLSAAEGIDEGPVEPGLVDLERRVDEDAVPEEPLDVVALVGAAVGEDVHAVFPHRTDDRRRRYRPAERRGVEVLLAPAGQVEGTALDGDDALAHERLTAVDQTRGLRSVARRDGRDVRHVALVRLGEIGRVGEDVEALPRHPRHGAARVEAPREGNSDAGPLGGEGAMNPAHGASDTTKPGHQQWYPERLLSREIP